VQSPIRFWNYLLELCLSLARKPLGRACLENRLFADVFALSLGLTFLENGFLCAVVGLSLDVPSFENGFPAFRDDLGLSFDRESLENGLLLLGVDLVLFLLFLTNGFLGGGFAAAPVAFFAVSEWNEWSMTDIFCLINFSISLR
jgi:hypothetical protein